MGRANSFGWTASYVGESRTVNSCISYINEEELERFERGHDSGLLGRPCVDGAS